MMCRLAELLQCKFPNIHVHIYKIRNDFFGETITVSGLLTGGDIIRQLKGKELGECLLLPCNVLRSGEDVFLDDVTLDEMKTALQVEVNIVKSGGKDLLLAFTKQPDLPEEDIRKEEQETAGFVYEECYPDRSWR
jgi:NifB/MoaA-like Fe-S oxidoreductase